MALATESGYGAFLPTYQNEYVNREALRGQMIKQASYLTDMDQIYADLEERSREFDITSAYNEKLLAQRASEFDRSLELDWAKQETSSYTAHSEAALEQQKLTQAQNQYNQKRADNQASNQDLLSLLSSSYVSSDYQDIWAGVAGTSASGTTYDQYGNVVQGAGVYNYASDYNDAYWNSL